MYKYIFTHVAHFNCAWDAATGNGQVARVLAQYFRKVYANDASEKQIEYALPVSNIEFFVSLAESTHLATNSIDLITIAQGLHWLNHETFYSEVRRVSKNEGIIAAWAYGPPSVTDLIDPIIRRFNSEIIAPYWPKERRYVEMKYETIPFPFKRITTPQFYIEKQWSLPELTGYISTWSSVRNYVKDRGVDPLDTIRDHLVDEWGHPPSKRIIKWPIYLLLGSVI